MKQELHPFLKPVDLESSFKLKNDHDEVIVEILTLDALKTAIDGVPDTSLLFHMDGRNDFANWVNEVVGFKALGKELAGIRMNEKHPEEARRNMAKVLDYTLKVLKEI